MREKILEIMIIQAVPFLNRFRKPTNWAFSHTDMRMMTTGCLGRDVADFLDSRNFFLLPKYEVHDTLHVLLKYGTTPKEELKLQGFMIGNKSVTFGGKVLFLLSILIKPEYFKDIISEIKRGKKANSIKNFPFQEVLTQNTERVRNQIGIPEIINY